MLAVTNAGRPDTIVCEGLTYDLTSDDGRAQFVATLALPESQATAVKKALAEAETNSRDELAQIAQAWSKAEHGEPSPTRMIVSGHYADDGPMGENNGNFTWESLAALAAALPAGASRIEDLNLSACSTAGTFNKQRLSKIFTGLKSNIWAYSGTSPGAGMGATQHQASWEKATRGDGIDLTGAREGMIHRRVRWADHVDVQGVDDAPPLSVDEARQKVDELKPVFEPYFSGSDVVTKEVREYGKLRQYYAAMQTLAQHPDCPEDERQDVEARRSQTIRLLYFDKVKGEFAATYREALSAGYKALGLKVPKLAHASRKAAIEAVNAFEARALSGPLNDDATEVLRLLRGLRDLNDPKVIPRNWL